MKISQVKNIGLVLAGASLFSCASVVTQPDWDFIQSVGGVKAEKLEMLEGIYYLPVEIDFASYKPGTKSEMVCVDTSARIAGKQILLRIKTDAKKNAPNATAQCPNAKIGGIPDGNYRVVYIGPEGESHKVSDVVANLAGN